MCLTEPDVDAGDPYKVLGLQRSATDKEICAAYKRLALRYHPDKNINNRDRAEHAFKQVTAAYETVRDPARRKQYEHAGNHAQNIPGNVGSVDRTDELYRMFFGAGKDTSVPDINIAGIFNFDQKPRHKPACKPARPASPTHLLLSGTPVVIHGLACKPQHNGKSGKISEWSAAKCRYEVALNCGSVLSLRPQNLTQLCHVTVNSQHRNLELNGKSAEIVDFNEDSGHYVLLVEEPPSVVELPPENCIFPAGTPAVLQGLSDETLNGKMCTVVAVDHNASRYVVECQGGRQLKVRYERIMG